MTPKSASACSRTKNPAASGGVGRPGHGESQDLRTTGDFDLAAYVPKEIGQIGNDHQKALPRIAKDRRLTRLIDEALRQLPTRHHLYLRDARQMDFPAPESVHLVVCSPPYWTLKEYRKGAYRKPTLAARVMSVIAEENHRKWFRLVWDDLPGASTRKHPAPFPVELAERLIRMFSFAGDTVLDPFVGTGTTMIAAARSGRNSIGIEVDPHYWKMASKRIAESTQSLFSRTELVLHAGGRTHD